jgi:thiamine biosynthesis protein ThiS
MSRQPKTRNPQSPHAGISVVINGQETHLEAPQPLLELLVALGINHKAVVVERNLEIVERHDLDRQWVADGDRIEIIRLVGGG